MENEPKFRAATDELALLEFDIDALQSNHGLPVDEAALAALVKGLVRMLHGPTHYVNVEVWKHENGRFQVPATNCLPMAASTMKEGIRNP